MAVTKDVTPVTAEYTLKILILLVTLTVVGSIFPERNKSFADVNIHVIATCDSR